MGTSEPELRLQNALANSQSPYLRSHSDNPVAWQEWSETTLSLAKQHQRLIFLSVGYNACHWCHVMERESFSSPEVAEILNTYFIPVKLDREVRPDLDDIYMSYVTATTGSGGWPLNVFLTPDLKPVFGGTYWPGPNPATNPNQATSHDEVPVTFVEILKKMKDVWTTQRERCLQSSSEITDQLLAFAGEGMHSHSDSQARDTEPTSSDPPEPLDLDLLDEALTHFVSRYDALYGGFSPDATAPKFPTTCNLTFLLRIGAAIAQPSTHTRFGFFSPVPGILGKDSCLTAARMSLHTLLAMSRSGIRDQLGYGFHRYSVTADWNLPHFEKMMCDNAQLLGCFCDAWALGRDPEVLGTIYNLVEYFTNPESPIINPEGGWYSSEDADSRSTISPLSNGAMTDDRKEGAFYVWTLKEFQSILGERDSSILARHFGVKVDGNVPAQHDSHDEFLTQNVLHIHATPSVLAKEFGLAEEEIVRIVKSGRAKLVEHRKTKREQPQVDTKIIASWNALAITALARAANTLVTIDRHRAQRCQEAAEKAAAFIRREMYNESTGQLYRVHPRQSPEPSQSDRNTAFVDDYAYLTQANLSLYDLNLSQPYLDWAVRLQSYLDENFFATTTGGYFQCPRPSDPSLSEQIIRLKPGTDNALPSPNGTICTNLLYLSSYIRSRSSFQDNSSTTESYIPHARATLDAFAVEVLQHPFLYVTLLGALVMEQVGLKTLVAPMTIRDSELRRLKGWGRTVVKGIVSEVMICSLEGVCRPLKREDLEDVDELEEDGLDSKRQSVDNGAFVAADGGRQSVSASA
ncbi:hypothetical protein H2200_010771 [Cladophialophora chaetospira]|uniref:Spermatogenesis-associated protein 20-like TRX domain-containing protein n=1 Tax=Cladophialophora chaetospira TaxID=386627 RepID=A0AA39CDY3_9EURO|nr:hypothetical protein H2200_010771 [Cladophialophora chaetospira]